MASLIERTTHAVSRSCSRLVAEIFRKSSCVIQCRSFSHEALNGRFPPSSVAFSAVHQLVDSPLFGEFPLTVSKTEKFGGEAPILDRNAYFQRKWEGFRVPIPALISKPELTWPALEGENPLCNSLRPSPAEKQDSHHDYPRQGFVGGNKLPIGSASGGGNTDVSKAVTNLKLRQQQGIFIDAITFVETLKRCLSQEDLLSMKQVHACIVESKMLKNPYVANNLLNAYVRCGSLQDARRLFDALENRDKFTWTIMIAGYAKRNQAEEAMEVFKQMHEGGVQASELLCLSIVNACATPSALQWGKQVHAYIKDAGFMTDVRVGNALIQMYAKCGCITEARQVFEAMTNKNVITFSVMVDAYAQSGSIDDARAIFDRMGKRDVKAWTIMIGAYAKSGRGAEAYALYMEMKREGFKPDAVTYLSILNDASASDEALEWVTALHSDILKVGMQSDTRVGNALIHMYAKCGAITDARLVFDRMEKRDVTAWTVMIGAYAERGSGVEAYNLFLQMESEGFKANAVTYASILNASATGGALNWVKEVHAHAGRAGLESDLRVGSALVHMYAKCGSLDDARLVFNRMERRDVTAWNIMIGGLAQHGCGHEALELFGKMSDDRVKPNESSFVAVLSACCHGGLVEDGQRLFSAMTKDYGIVPTVVHYTCMVDLLGRAGQLEKAKLLIDEMPMRPNAVTWKALLGACRSYGNVKLGEVAAEEVLNLEPNDASGYILLSNIYAAAGMWEKVLSVRTMMDERGVRKDAGRSWIEVDNEIHEFVVGDTSHPEASAIYMVLKRLTEKLKAEGYVPDTKLVLQDMDEEAKELALCSHSEKLAIAYGLLHIPRGIPIRVYKNLRVCSDCHTAIKLISKMTGREVIARDANRFHHFKDGVCSCGDYW